MRSMYLYKNKDIIQTTREKALTACKNEEENFMNVASKSMAKSRRRIIHKARAICWNYNGNHLIINYVKVFASAIRLF